MSNISQWRAISEQTSFPFTERCLPELSGLFIDARIILPKGSDGSYLKSISINGDIISFDIRSVDGAKIGVAQIAAGIGGTASLIDGNGIYRGILVISKDKVIQIIPKSFNPESARFESTCCVASEFKRVSSIAVNKVPYVGKIALVEGDGIKLVKVSDSVLRIDAVGSKEISDACCKEEVGPIRGINDAVPDSYGNISFNIQPFTEPDGVADTIQALRISLDKNGIIFYLSK